MSQAIIRAALEGRLNGWATAQSIPVAWENVAFVPAVAQPYARAFILPANTVSADIGRANRRYEGVFQVSLAFPEGTGPGALESLFATLDAQFQPSSPIVSSGFQVWLSQPMSLGPQIPEPGYYVRAASVPYLLDRY